MTEPLI